MNKNSIKVLTILFILSTIAAVATYIISGGYDQKNISVIRLNEVKLDEEIKVDVNEVKVISVDVASENVYVTQSDSKQAVIRGFGTISTSIPLKKYDLVVEQSNGVVEVRIEHDDIEEESWYYDNNVDIFIYLPIEYTQSVSISSRSSVMDIKVNKLNNLDIVTDSGAFILDELAVNNMSFESISGTAKINNLETQSVDIATDSGDVLIEKLISETVKGYTVSGSLMIHDITGNFYGSCESGLVSIAAAKLDGDIEIESRSGDVELFLQDEEDAMFDLKTSSGRMKMGLEGVETLKNTSIRAMYKSNKGKNQIIVSTTNGNILIREKR